MTPSAKVGETLYQNGRIIVVEYIANVLNPFIVTKLFIFQPFQIVYISMLCFNSWSPLDVNSVF